MTMRALFDYSEPPSNSNLAVQGDNVVAIAASVAVVGVAVIAGIAVFVYIMNRQKAERKQSERVRKVQDEMARASKGTTTERDTTRSQSTSTRDSKQSWSRKEPSKRLTNDVTL